MNSHLRSIRVPFAPVFLALLLALQGCSKDEPETSKTPVQAAPVEEAAADTAEERPAVQPVQEPPESSTPPPSPRQAGREWLARFAGLDLDEVFDAVAQGIRYEPYSGVLRGGAGTLLAGSGNALDQSILLAEILRHKGYRVRFVSGTLNGDNLAVAVRGLYAPEIPQRSLSADFAPYDPNRDSTLRAARDHFWVEVYQPGAWLPLDPSFPRAQPGEAYAVAKTRYDQVPQTLYQRLKMSWWQELRDGKKSKLGSLDETVVALGLKPLTLIAHRTPKSSTDDGKKSRGTADTFGGLGGALSGSKPEATREPAVPELVAVEHQRQIYVKGSFEAWEGTLVAEQERNGYIRREWLEFEVTAPGAAPVRSLRDLYRHQADGPQEPPAVRHYSVSVVPGPVSEDWLRGERDRTAATLDQDEWQRELRRAKNVEPGSEAATTLAPRLREHGSLAGIGGGHLVGLAYAAASDAMSRQVAWANGVEIIWPHPRVLITSIETEDLEKGGTDSYVTLDLRIDSVQAVPFPGFPARAAALFQTARGLQNSVLEGVVLGHATGLDTPSTTAVVMFKAADDGTPLLTIVPANVDQLDGLDNLPGHSSELITEALRSGHDVIVPESAVRVGNRDRWGWWQVNRDTGEVIGVMDDGQHQASTNYTFNLSKVGLDDRSGFAIGAIIGANSTLFTISGLMLKYGETSAQMIAEVERYVQSVMCRSCPSKAGVSAGASAGVSSGNDCFKVEKKIEASIGVSAKIGFCQSYQDGFACASGMLLQGLTGSGGVKTTMSAEAGVSVQVNCETTTGGKKLEMSR